MSKFLWIGGRKSETEWSGKMRLSKNSRCVIVMTNLAFAPEGRKRIETSNRVIDMGFKKEFRSGLF